jgi:branched-chain amino acid transport system ATP-binding protein
VRLELHNVTAAYGETVALRNVSLTVPSGRVVALLGPNGAGKTTLLKIASGLLKPSAGSVSLDDVDTTGLSPVDFVRAGVCHIPEGRSVFPGLDVKDNLRMFATREGEEESIERAISAFPILGRRLNQIAGTMSGGEQQMLSLARTYARRSPLVLLDEVSMGLAPIIVDEIFEFLARLKDEGISLLLVEQYAAKALNIADIVYLLVRGRIVRAGEADEIAGADIFTHYLGAEVAE